MATLRDRFLSGGFDRQPVFGSVRAGIDESIGRGRQREALESQELANQFAPAREERAIQTADIQAQKEERARIDAAKKGILESVERDRIEGVRVARSVAEAQTDDEFAFLQKQNPIDLGQSTFEEAKLNSRFLLAANDEIEKEKTVADPQIVQLQNAKAATNDPARKREIQAQIDKIGRSAGPLVKIEGDKPSQTGQFGASAVARSATIIERGQKADAIINSVAEMRNSLRANQGTALEAGAFADLRLGLANVAQTLGITDEFTQQIANAENFQSLSNAVVLAESEAMKGVLSDNDVKFLKSIAPQLEKSGLGNEFILSRMENVAIMDKIRFARGQEIELGNPGRSNLENSRQLDNEFAGIPYVGRNLRTDAGVPIFFASFFQNFKAANPDATVKEAAELFRSLDVEKKE